MSNIAWENKLRMVDDVQNCVDNESKIHEKY